MYFSRDSFDASKQYYVTFLLKHPGSESWPGVLQEIFFTLPPDLMMQLRWT